MITIPGLAELVVWIPALLIPSILIYFDARKKGKNHYFWSAVIFGCENQVEPRYSVEDTFKT